MRIPLNAGLILAALVRLRHGRRTGHAAAWLTRRTVIGGALALGAAGGGLVVLADTVRVTQLEGEAMRATGGIQYHQGGLVLPGGPTRIEIDAAEDTTLPPGPRLELWAAEVRVGDCDRPAGPGGWTRRSCVVTGALRRGPALLELRFTSGLPLAARSHRRHLYVDRIRIQPSAVRSPAAPGTAL